METKVKKLQWRDGSRPAGVILPITHSVPTGDTVGMKIPPKVAQALGLDEARNWVLVSDHNVDESPR
jgi:hypothetical protein